MGVKLSQIIPNDIRTTIPLCFRDVGGNVVTDSIKIYTPTIKSVEEFQKESVKIGDSDIEILRLLIKHFTDIEDDINDEKIRDFQIYFDDVWNALQDELFMILGTIIKDGINARSKIMKLDDQSIDYIKDKHDKDLGEQLEKNKKQFELEQEYIKLEKRKKDLFKEGV